MIPSFQELPSQSTELNRIQSQVSKTFDKITACPLLDGILIEDVALTTSATNVNHKLNRAPLGWIVVDNNANAVVYSSAASLPKQYLTLTASAACTVSLWVF